MNTNDEILAAVHNWWDAYKKSQLTVVDIIALTKGDSLVDEKLQEECVKIYRCHQTVYKRADVHLKKLLAEVDTLGMIVRESY